MTEAEWLACTDLNRMLEFLSRRASDRKLRLFACACFGRIWDRLPATIWRAVEVSERYANGLTDERAWAAAWTAAEPPLEDPMAAMIWLASRPPTSRTALEEAGWATMAALSLMVKPTEEAAWYAFLAAEATLLREIVNPFHLVPLDPSWQSWHDGLLVSMARQMYDSRDFTDMPVLADALEEAGCQDQDILVHCRSGGEHVRGCWVVDALLSKS
jgi:hypothetical protein